MRARSQHPRTLLCMEPTSVPATRALKARDLWLEELRVRSSSPLTISSYLAHTDEALGACARYLEVERDALILAAITRDSLIAALGAYRSRPDGRASTSEESLPTRERERSASSVARHLASMKAFLQWCVLTEKLTKNPATSVAAPKTPKRVPKALSVEACGTFLEAAGRTRWPERDRLLVMCGLAMGLRLAEIAGLRPDSFSPSAAAPTHVKVFGKGSKERTVPVPAAVRELLTAYLPTRTARLERFEAQSELLFCSMRPSTRNGEAHLDASREGLGQTFNRIIEDAGLKKPGLRAHVTRHSFATAAISSHVFGIEQVAQLMGHSSIETTAIYVRVDPERLSAGAELHPLALLQQRTSAEDVVEPYPAETTAAEVVA